MPEPPKRIIVGITGASGAAYAQRIIEILVAANIETHIIISPLGQRLLSDEINIQANDLAALANRPSGSTPPASLIAHSYRDVGAPLASGSFSHGGMIVVPCSSNTLGAVATGSAQNLLHRAAHVTLKERRKLVLVHREMPLSLVDIRNMTAATEAGAIICPASPGFYLNPHSLQDVVDFVAGRCLDLLDVPHDLKVRWGE